MNQEIQLKHLNPNAVGHRQKKDRKDGLK